MSGYCEDCGNTLCICDEIDTDVPSSPEPNDRDRWNLDLWLARCIVNAMRAQREDSGHPVGLTREEWETQLTRIERGFQAYADNDGRPFFDGKTAYATFAEAFDLLRKHFEGLWT